MALKYREYANRRDWLKSRKDFLGASEIAVIAGYSSFSTPQRLWAEKTGKCEPQNLESNFAVHYGAEAEKHLRGLWKLKHEQGYALTYHPYRVYYREETPYLACTLDGELSERETRRKGIYECKTAFLRNKGAMDEWKDSVPSKYYCQCCYQLGITGWKYAIVNAELIYDDRSEIREYVIEAAGNEANIAYLLECGKNFWENVQTDTEPPVVFRL